jgi:colanic acid/amylovoran biosynthesis glycosyltransferase
MKSKPNVIFFAGNLLPASETFIKAQGEQLRTYKPYYVGSRLIKGLTLPPEQAIVVNQGGRLGFIQESVYKMWGIAPHFYQKIQSLNPSLIHAHFGVCGALALPLKRILKVPMIVTFYGEDATMTDEFARTSSLSTKIFLKKRDFLKREADLFIGVSDFIKQRLIAQGFPEEKIISHYYGVDIQQFQPDLTVSRKPIVLYVGRFSEKKGCEYLIRAMAKIQETNDEIEFVLIGDGELKAEVENLAAKLLRRHQILGFQSSCIVRQWMNQSMVLVVPSVTASTGDCEGLPTVIVEAQAMGLPVIASDHAGIPQAVIQGETGFLTPEKDVDAIAKYILMLFQDPQLCQKLSYQGKDHVRQNFDQTKQAQTLERIYDEILQQSLSNSQDLKLS